MVEGGGGSSHYCLIRHVTRVSSKLLQFMIQIINANYLMLIKYLMLIPTVCGLKAQTCIMGPCKYIIVAYETPQGDLHATVDLLMFNLCQSILRLLPGNSLEVGHRLSFYKEVDAMLQSVLIDVY